MIELEKLSTEKQQKLLDVIGCFKVSEKKFEKEFDLLDIEDKKTTISYIIDNVYEYDDRNKDIVVFFKQDKYKSITKELSQEFEIKYKEDLIKTAKENKVRFDKFYKKYPTYDEKSFSDEDIIKFKEIIKDIDDDDFSQFDTLNENEKIRVVLEIIDSKYDVDHEIKFLIKDELEQYFIDSFLLPCEEDEYSEYLKNK
jgi:hypothetical protein